MRGELGDLGRYDSTATMLGVKGSSLGTCMPELMLWWVLASLISYECLTFVVNGCNG